MLLHDILIRAERYHGNRPAIVNGSRVIHYAKLGDRVRRAAAALIGLSLAPGTHIAIVADNGQHFLEAYFACSLAGLVAVPVNGRLAPAEVAAVLEDGDCAAVLFDDAHRALIADDHRRHVLLGEQAQGGVSCWEALIADTHPDSVSFPEATERDVVHICYTGGTTGRPKGVMLSHRNVVASTTNKILLGSFQRDDVWLHAAPMFHQADSWACFAFTLLGAAHIFAPRFDAMSVVETMEKHGVTGTQVVPTMILMLLDVPGVADRDLTCIRRILYGSAPMPIEHLRRAESVFGPVFQHIYGLTEAAGTVAATPWPMAPQESAGIRRGSCGQPVTGVNVRIVGAAGESCPPDTVGRILVSGPTVMGGYWRQADATRAVLDAGWLDTGDLGRLDDEGYLYVVDRAKDMIITGGENVYPSEVENALCAHACVAEAAVIGVQDAKWGEAVKAIVVPRLGKALDPEDLLEHCRGRLARYKCPKSIDIVESLPRTPTGKIAKSALRDVTRRTGPTS